MGARLVTVLGQEGKFAVLQPARSNATQNWFGYFVFYIFFWIKRLTRTVLRRSPEIAKHIRALFRRAEPA
jgi:hypothetical protein